MKEEEFMVKTIYKVTMNDHSNLGLAMGLQHTKEIWHAFCVNKKKAENMAVAWIKATYPQYYEQHGKDLKKHWGDLGAIGVSITTENLYGEKNEKRKPSNSLGRLSRKFSKRVY